MPLIFDPPSPPTLPVEGLGDLPVGRIFCVGRNYAAHAAEMGNEVDRDAPFYFTKSPSSVLRTGRTLPYPPGTQDLHHEVELVVAIGAPVFKGLGGKDAVLAYGVGLDMTRRDLQAAAKEGRKPWDLGKDFEGSAVLAPMVPASEVVGIGGQMITLSVNGQERQSALLSDMVWSVSDIVDHLSQFYRLRPGDLIMTGTPAGVGAVIPGDRLEGRIEGLPPVTVEIGAPE
ncbi:fumarylacetoacetate hydrolase family protein [Oceaniovalibus guishaninsula JLT2003]|uniref:Fumarylacetoacetate hydrolase family protein n=1 Tax=Oceaniovalibus guishaninsula JLT2003 TaxID=1231392 RepID=K2HSA4_9RHOB|nr:fumarylacetoacetate hydrolase family protein [Oceaniovalibus guishaninsula]EKE45559.1 fumarylacetoacetate hydrolase family protein [Oceaniovalibus guishaninsula JLT2003]